MLALASIHCGAWTCALARCGTVDSGLRQHDGRL